MAIEQVPCLSCGSLIQPKNNVRKRKYCSMKCNGVALRKNKTIEQKKQEKKIYDMQYRSEKRDLLKEKKRNYYQKTRHYWLKKLAEKRNTPGYKERHREYLSTYWTAERLALKKDYDRKFRAKKRFGPLWEAHYLTVLLNEEVQKRISKYEIYKQTGRLNKALQRSRNGTVKRGYT